MTAGEFFERVVQLCRVYHCSMTSGPRTEKRNARVGGSKGSRHLISNGGKAADLVPDENTQEQRQKVCGAARAVGLWALDETDHVHVDGRDPA